MTGILAGIGSLLNGPFLNKVTDVARGVLGAISGGRGLAAGLGGISSILFPDDSSSGNSYASKPILNREFTGGMPFTTGKNATSDLPMFVGKNPKVDYSQTDDVSNIGSSELSTRDFTKIPKNCEEEVNSAKDKWTASYNRYKETVRGKTASLKEKNDILQMQNEELTNQLAHMFPSKFPRRDVR